MQQLQLLLPRTLSLNLIQLINNNHNNQNDLIVTNLFNQLIDSILEIIRKELFILAKVDDDRNLTFIFKWH